MNDEREARNNAAVNPSRPPAEGRRDDIGGLDELDVRDAWDNAAVNPSRPPAEGGRDVVEPWPPAPAERRRGQPRGADRRRG